MDLLHMSLHTLFCLQFSAAKITLDAVILLMSGFMVSGEIGSTVGSVGAQITDLIFNSVRSLVLF